MKGSVGCGVGLDNSEAEYSGVRTSRIHPERVRQMNRGNFQLCRRASAGQLGMTLLESLVAIIMLVVFTSVVALVMQFTLRFFSAAESGDRNEFEVSNGVLIDHQQIQMAMDDLVEVLYLNRGSAWNVSRAGAVFCG